MSQLAQMIPKFTLGDRHLDHLRRRNLRPNSIILRKAVLRRFAMSIAPVGLLDATREDVQWFLGRLNDPRSRAVELTQLRGFYKWCVEEDILQVDPTARVERPRVQRTLPRPIADDCLTAALHNAPDRVKPWLMLAAYAGLRAFDIANLRAENVLLDRDPPMLLLETKGGKMRSVPISVHLKAEIERWGLPRKGWCFTRRDGNSGPVTPHLVSKYANTYLHDIGISDTLHSLRHWFATKAYVASGRDLRATQELLGHESPQSTQIYTWVDPGALRGAVEGLPIL